MSSIQLDRGGGESIWVEAGLVSGARIEGARRLDCGWRNGVEISPGEINAHTHLYSGLVPFGLPASTLAPRSFREILARIWWRLDRALDEASLRTSARLYLAEALLAGTTTVVDHHESPTFIEGSLDLLADAAQELGVRLIAAYGVTERNGGRDEARRGLAECRRFICENRRPLVRGLVGIHAAFTVSDETLREAGELARELGTAVHVHLAEDLVDVEDAVKRGYEGPLERLLELDALPPGSILAHGVHLDRAQVQRAAAAGLWIVQNPRSNEGNRVGYPSALTASSAVALGTDGYPSDLAVERAALQRLGRANGEGEEVLAERGAGGLRLVAERFNQDFGGSRMTLGFAQSQGVGSVADLVVRVAGDPARHVLVGGEVAVLDGRLARAELDEIRAHAIEEAPRVFRRMKALQ